MHLRFFRLTALLLLIFLLLPAQPARAADPDPEIGEPVETQVEPGESGVEPQYTGCSRVNVAVQNAAYEQQVVDLVNLRRAENSLPPLKRNTDLDYAARFHSKDMHDDGYTAHDSYDGDTMVCVWSARISNFYSGWSTLGENIAWGYTTPAAVMQGWMNSSGHKANILGSGYREFGVGYYSNYWTQDFGARSGVYPLVINREAASTTAPQVNLYIYRQDSTWTEMRLRNDSGTWSAWQAFAADKAWTLDWTGGTRTVTVEVRKGSTVRQASDTIDLTTSGNSLGNLPNSLRFIYDQSTGKMSPPSVTLQPRNASSGAVLTWQAVSGAGWLNPQSGSGSTPNSSITVAPSGSTLQNVGSYNTILTFTAPSAPTKQIQVELIVVDALDNTLFLSSIAR